VRRVPLDDWQDRQKKRKNRENEGLHSPGRPCQSARMCFYNCVGYLLVFSWLLSCVIECLVCQSSYIYVYYEDQKKERIERQRKNRQMHERTNERNILNITKRPLIYSICDYEEQTSLCDLSSFLLRMYLMGCPSSFLSLYDLSCSTRVMRKKKRRKKAKRFCNAMHLANIKEKKEKNDFFFASR
jgi:hypothetical protein